MLSPGRLTTKRFTISGTATCGAAAGGVKNRAEATLKLEGTWGCRIEVFSGQQLVDLIFAFFTLPVDAGQFSNVSLPGMSEEETATYVAMAQQRQDIAPLTDMGTPLVVAARALGIEDQERLDAVLAVEANPAFSPQIRPPEEIVGWALPPATDDLTDDTIAPLELPRGSVSPQTSRGTSSRAFHWRESPIWNARSRGGGSAPPGFLPSASRESVETSRLRRGGGSLRDQRRTKTPCRGRRQGASRSPRPTMPPADSEGPAIAAYHEAFAGPSSRSSDSIKRRAWVIGSECRCESRGSVRIQGATPKATRSRIRRVVSRGCRGDEKPRFARLPRQLACVTGSD